MANYMVLDTETAPLFGRKTDQPEPWNSLVYDLGYIICDAQGDTLLERSFVIADTFHDLRVMNSAYYADKRALYLEGTALDDSGEWREVSALEAWRTMRQDMKEHEVKTVWAYNCKFDSAALDATIRHYSNGFCAFWMPYKTRVRDIWDYASCITSTKRFVEWTVAAGRLTASGNPSTSAETVYAYLNGMSSFTELHTALEDCYIELEILQSAKRRHAKTRHSKGQGWRDAAAKKRELGK